MSASLRRGACPTLAAPMQTGDGLLARLTLTEGLTPPQLAGLASAAARHGNGRIEITARGSLQIRGLSEATTPELGAALAALGIVPAGGIPIVTTPLAGLDPTAIADPRPLAADLRESAARAGLDRRLPPKVSVVVDGGGLLHLDAVVADLRLRAMPRGWHLSVGGTAGTARPLGLLEAATGLRAALAILDHLAVHQARGRNLPPAVFPTAAAPLLPRPRTNPVGPLTPAPARGFGFPFGQADATMIEALAMAAPQTARFWPAPGRALIVVGLADAAEAALVRTAGELGFVTHADDPRLRIAACSGAPACASAMLPTRALAARLAAERPLLAPGVMLHLSGCPKRCAQPSGPTISLVAGPDGAAVTGEQTTVPDALRTHLIAEAGVTAA